LGEPVAQAGEPTYAAKLDPAEYEIDWTKPAADIVRLTRLEQAWTTFRGRRLKVLHAAAPDDVANHASLTPGSFHGLVVGAGDGLVQLVRVQPEGKPAMEARAWVNGARPTATDRLGQ
jgi:methionyl-tRNA formyltransferase